MHRFTLPHFSSSHLESACLRFCVFTQCRNLINAYFSLFFPSSHQHFIAADTAITTAAIHHRHHQQPQPPPPHQHQHQHYLILILILIDFAHLTLISLSKPTTALTTTKNLFHFEFGHPARTYLKSWVSKFFFFFFSILSSILAHTHSLTQSSRHICTGKNANYAAAAALNANLHAQSSAQRSIPNFLSCSGHHRCHLRLTHRHKHRTFDCVSIILRPISAQLAAPCAPLLAEEQQTL